MQEELGIPEQFYGDLYYYTYLRQIRSEHKHRELEFNLVLQGTATYLVDGKRHDIRTGMIIWLFPGQEHVLVRESPDFVMWIGVYKPDFVSKFCVSSSSYALRQQKPDGDFCRCLRLDDARWLLSVLTQLSHARSDVSLFNAGLGYTLLLAWSAYCSADELGISSILHPAVNRAVQLLVEKPETESVEEIAREAGLSESRLRALFKAQTGVTLVDFRSYQRIWRFHKIYGNGQGMNITHTALEAGFGSYTQFHRVFKSIMGYGPAQFRRSLSITSGRKK